MIGIVALVTPSWVNHIALRLASLDELEFMRGRLPDAGVEVLGVTDHHFVKSIYLFDPNGIRPELTVPIAAPEQLAGFRARARWMLDEWTLESANPQTRPA